MPASDDFLPVPPDFGRWNRQLAGAYRRAGLCRLPNLDADPRDPEQGVPVGGPHLGGAGYLVFFLYIHVVAVEHARLRAARRAQAKGDQGTPGEDSSPRQRGASLPAGRHLFSTGQAAEGRGVLSRGARARPEGHRRAGAPRPMPAATEARRRSATAAGRRVRGGPQTRLRLFHDGAGGDALRRRRAERGACRVAAGDGATFVSAREGAACGVAAVHEPAGGRARRIARCADGRYPRACVSAQARPGLGEEGAWANEEVGRMREENIQAPISRIQQEFQIPSSKRWRCDRSDYFCPYLLMTQWRAFSSPRVIQRSL